MNCPRCGKPAECDEVDNGVGMQQCGPYYCQPCDWVQPDPLEELLSPKSTAPSADEVSK